MILQGNYSDSTKQLILSFNEEINKKSRELETALSSLHDAGQTLAALRQELKLHGLEALPGLGEAEN